MRHGTNRSDQTEAKPVARRTEIAKQRVSIGKVWYPVDTKRFGTASGRELTPRRCSIGLITRPVYRYCAFIIWTAIRSPAVLSGQRRVNSFPRAERGGNHVARPQP